MAYPTADPARIDRLFRPSDLYHPKGQRKDDREQVNDKMCWSIFSI